MSGCLFLLAGFGITVHLPINPVVKFILGTTWIADTVRELARQSRGHTRVRCLMLDSAGRMTARNGSGKIEEVQVLKGSVVVNRWAWMRLGFGDGLHYVEWLSRDDSPPDSWRRLQLIWRHAL